MVTTKQKTTADIQMKKKKESKLSTTEKMPNNKGRQERTKETKEL